MMSLLLSGRATPVGSAGDWLVEGKWPACGKEPTFEHFALEHEELVETVGINPDGDRGRVGVESANHAHELRPGLKCLLKWFADLTADWLQIETREFR